MKKSLFLSGFLFLAFIPINSQSFLTPDDNLINGYIKKTAGLDYEYHSCIPGLRESFLMRATSGKDFVEWETDAVPAGIKKKYATFVWVAAIGSSPGRAKMEVAVNGQKTFTFYTDGPGEWKIRADGESSLSFHSILVDQHGDNHGYMVLRIPSASAVPGKTLTIRVTGGNDNLTSWYMTFKKEVKTGVTLNPFPAILKSGNGPTQLVEAGVFYFGEEAMGKIYANGKLLETVPLRFGYNAVNLGLSPVSKPSKITMKVEAGGFTATNTVTLEPVRKWTVDFIQHSHTDIGYTRSQTEILAEHLRYIDYALDYCDATDSYPENAKFRWTCEASWPVDEYLKCRPAEQIERLLKRIREGRIEVTGMYFNFDEIPDEKILASSLAAAGRIKEKGIPVTVAMQNDVNGIGWCMNDYFSQLGVKYLNMGTHGHRALICFDKPTMFWWESPSGKRMLTFRAEHYMTGNTLLEMQRGDMDLFKKSLLNYLGGLAAKGYPYDEMAIQHSGYLTDNSPPSTIASDLIRKWNDMFEWPKLTTSTTESFFRNIEQKHAGEFPVIRGAWPDWWTDGFGAGARETAATRLASAALTANRGGLSMARIAGISLPEKTGEKTELADNALLFFTEHTTGYSESVREPFSQPTMEQRALKESYAWEANRRTASIGEETMGLLQSMFSREKDPSLIVFNTLSWERSGLAEIYIDRQIVPRGKIPAIYDSSGKRMRVQAVSGRSDGTLWAVWLEKIPAFGYRKYILKPEDAPEPEVSESETGTLENRWYSLKADGNRGALSSLFDKDLSLELIDSNSPYLLGEFILETLGNRSQMESRKLDDYSRHPLDSVWISSVKTGEIWNSIKFTGESETTINPRGYSMEVRLYNTEKRIDIACSIVKKSIVEPESFYIAFPFGLNAGKHFTEVAGGIIETGKDQIPGSSNDWYTVQTFTSVRNSNSQLLLGCTEMPLMQFGAINTGRYKAGALPQGTNLFSWPMNNYWVTNFNAEQRGGHSWKYYFTSSGDPTDVYASKFGWGCRVPYLTRILPGDGSGDGKNEGSFITGWPSNVILVASEPGENENSLLMQLRETGGRHSDIKLVNGLTGKELKVREVDANGKDVAALTTPDKAPAVTVSASAAAVPSIGPHESKFFRISLE